MINIPKSKKRSIELKQQDVIVLCIFPRSDPPLLIGAKPPETSNAKQKMSVELL